jgi:Tfp pilus assembly protein PilF
MTDLGASLFGTAPGDHLGRVTQALEANNFDRAVTLADAALAAGDEHVLFLNLSAFGREQQGDLEGAMTRLRRAMQLAPRDVTILTTAGRTLSQMGRDEEALVCFDAALLSDPRHAPAHHGRGLSLSMTGAEDEGRRSHMRAADLDPNYPDPLGSLADHALRAKNADAARTLAERALGLDPHQPAAALVLATLDVRSGDRKTGLARVEALLATPLSPLHRAAAEQLEAELLEALDRPVEAFDSYSRANAGLKATYGPVYAAAGVETAVDTCARLHAWFSQTAPSDWAAAPGSGAAPGGRGHVFLVGFVRSGTTLLEQVLASHPLVTALEEQATLRAITDPYFDTEAGLEKLRTLGQAEADELRADYWRRVGEFGVDPAGKTFVDKAPLSTLWLPMVAKLFPEAKVILAIRDPRDVVLSSFKHRFLINALTWPFTNLTETARFYSGLMGLADLYRTLLPTPIYQHRHEDLIADFDAEVGRICDFLGLEWTEALRDFTETAKQRDVRTPSAEQVRQPLNSSGMGRWRRYGPGVEPILPILAPWVERYGYAD